MFLNNNVIEKLPHEKQFKEMRNALNKLGNDTQVIISQWNKVYITFKKLIDELSQQINEGIKKKEDEHVNVFKELPAWEGKSGTEIGNEYQYLLRELERIRQIF